MDIAFIAATLAVALAAYLVVTDWFSLTPWNKVEDVPLGQKLLLSLTNYTPLVFIAFAIAQPSRILVGLALLVGLVDLLMHIAYWWVPYFRGATAEHKAEHARMFGGTTTFLPAIGKNPIPNAQHVVVGVLMLAMVATSGAVAVRIW